MANRHPNELTTGGKSVLARLAFAVVICASPFGARNAGAQTTAASPLAFEVASVKPHVFARNQFAFGAPSGASPIRITAIE